MKTQQVWFYGLLVACFATQAFGLHVTNRGFKNFSLLITPAGVDCVTKLLTGSPIKLERGSVYFYPEPTKSEDLCIALRPEFPMTDYYQVFVKNTESCVIEVDSFEVYGFGCMNYR